jgi:poly(A) polymerase
MRAHGVDWYHHLPKSVKGILETLQKAGFEAYVVGGCVRDLWLSLPPKDFDLVSGATPDEVEKLFPRTEGVGRQFGIMIVITEEGPVEVARFRADAEYRDGRHPTGVVFSSPEEDAKRRDFTINGLFYDPAKGEIIDYVEGIKDLEAKVIRCVGDPEQRFQEDSLRMLRAVRFHAQLAAHKFTLDPELVLSVQKLASRLSLVSRERVTQELEKIFLSPQPSVGLFDLVLTGLWPQVFLSPPPSAGVHANFDVLAETFLLFSSRPAAVPLFVAAAARWLPGWKHDAFVLTKETKAALKAVPPLCEKLARYPSLFRAEKKLLLNENFIFEAMAILEVEGNEAVQEMLDEAEQNRKDWAETKTLNPPPLLGGDDLLALGVKPGPEIKKFLELARLAQLNEEITTKAEALALVRAKLAGH